MAGGLLGALVNQTPFQHRLYHDFESLIWVVVYAMMIRRRNTLQATDPVMYGEFKEMLDGRWAGHSYRSVRSSHNDTISIGCSFDHLVEVRSWFSNAYEAAFFRDAMRLLRSQTQDAEFIAYEDICTLFKKHIQLAKESLDSNVAPN